MYKVKSKDIPQRPIRAKSLVFQRVQVPLLKSCTLLEGTESDTSKVRDLFLFEDACMPIVSNTSV